jgi:hypothetical protein
MLGRAAPTARKQQRGDSHGTRLLPTWMRDSRHALARRIPLTGHFGPSMWGTRPRPSLAHPPASQDDHQDLGNTPGEHLDVCPLAPPPQTTRLQALRRWSQPGSNRRPPACKASSLHPQRGAKPHCLRAFRASHPRSGGIRLARGLRSICGDCGSAAKCRCRFDALSWRTSCAKCHAALRPRRCREKQRRRLGAST